MTDRDLPPEEPTGETSSEPAQPGRPQEYQVGDAIAYGWQGFTKNAGAVLLIILGVVVIGGGVNALSTVVDNTFLQLLLSFVGFVLSFVIALGLIRAALAITDGRRPSLGEVFQGEGVAQYVIAAIVLGVGFGLLNVIGLVTILLLPFTLLAALVLTFFVQFVGYAILDEGADAFAGITRSFQVVRDNFGSLLLLMLAAIALNIVGALLCGIGVLVTAPVTVIAYAYTWRHLTGGQVAQPQ